MPTSYRRIARDIVRISIQSAASLSNGIVFVVLGLLFYLGEAQTAIFLSIAVILGVLIGIVNDIRARLALERLQLLTTPTFIRIDARGGEERVFAESLQVGDTIRLSLGEQVPCDATLIDAQNLEMSGALRTGESDSFSKRAGEDVQAGDMVVAGKGVARIHTAFADSALSKMTSSIKRYSVILSPMQQAIGLAIQYTGYLLLPLLLFVIVRGIYVHDSWVIVVQNAAALTSTLVPQGLMVATTLLLAYGALQLYKEDVLLQDVNATEKLGRIENLCIDKTGTLTENMPTVRDVHLYEGYQKRDVLALAAAYIVGSNDASQTARAIEVYAHETLDGEIAGSLPFTSQRQYGAVSLLKDGESTVLLMGGPDVFLPHIRDEKGKEWLRVLFADMPKDKRLLCLARAEGKQVPATLQDVSLHPIALFELESKLRPGTKEIIEFLQKRGVRVRVISGDNPETASAIAAQAGILHPDLAITGEEIDSLSAQALAESLNTYTIFARIRPELKEKLINALRVHGFTAMVGDGANDALAIKAADLGIAMFDGATATRQLASVVLVRNSFAAIPSGIRMADTIIANAELISSLYFFEIGLGLVLFVFVTLMGYAYPLSPQNVVFINYFTVGFPGILTFYWTMRGEGSTRHSRQSFLRKIVPLAALCGAVAGILCGILFVLEPQALRASSTAVSIGFILMSLMFFLFTPGLYSGVVTRRQRVGLVAFSLVEAAGLLALFLFPFARTFFAMRLPMGFELAQAGALSLIFAIAIMCLKRFAPQKI